jgi:hypothetical protein
VNHLLFVLAAFFYDAYPSDWYDNEHAPARLTVPGVLSATRYKATDSKPPSWIAAFDLASPGVIQSAGYNALWSNASVTEKSIVSRLSTLHRTVYSLFATLQNPNASSASFPAKFVLMAAIEPGNMEDEAEQNRWFAEEHLALLSKVPGFLRARRFKLVDHVELAGKADSTLTKPPAKYLTLCDWDRDTFFDTQEWNNVMSTPWAQKMLNILPHEIRMFTIHKSFSK